ncbi:TlpA family protein disulfide reductase [Hymenobacter sp. NST-14]|uniref:TlpA family protein disulfide reductase n=1 Tax=Hymenobacter piscis TaxID=2839984 RepID=UPI001C01BBC1|nr:TlpA disulfide reductase family protein [Hymenobacter piscis]MBT9393842.1 TlpA family protein disulfide reductase [Hymenobacter piscis]
MPVAFSFRKAIAGAGLALAAAACQSNSTSSDTTTPAANAAASPLSAGTWRGVLSAQGQEIPFLFDVAQDGGQPTVTLRNGEERLKLDEITTAGDSTTIRLGVFDAALVVRADGEGKLKGSWVKYDAGKPYRVPFAAQKGDQALFSDDYQDGNKLAPVIAPELMKGATYRVTFTGEEGETTPAVGIFTYDKTSGAVAGTFLTTTGDYRYLSGNIVRSKTGDFRMKTSTFDGSHAFLFDAKPTKPAFTELQGDFYSGLTGHETWTATLDPTAKLPDANALTGMKPGQKKLDFKFPSIYEGASISPSDPKYRGKVVVVQILGSWCPNCMDETNFLAPWYEQNKQRGVEIIGLGYERTTDQALAAQKLLKMKQRMNVGYDLAVAGQASSAEASKSLPQLQKVLAFPTTIFLDKKGEVRKIHTGFSGPGTGQYYEAEKAEFNKTIDQLLAE